MTKTKFTPAQRAILSALDGSFGHHSWPGTSKRPIMALAEMGLVTFKKTNNRIKVWGHPDRIQVRYVVTLTKKGSEFIYEGGIDK